MAASVVGLLTETLSRLYDTSVAQNTLCEGVLTDAGDITLPEVRRPIEGEPRPVGGPRNACLEPVRQ